MSREQCLPWDMYIELSVVADVTLSSPPVYCYFWVRVCVKLVVSIMGYAIIL